jgi:methionyl-tRNA synthetase
MDAYNLSQALENVWNIINYLNNYIQIKEPWKLKNDKEALSNVMYTLFEGIRHSAILVSPVMPFVSEKILKSLKAEEKSLEFGLMKSKSKIEKLPPIFPRLEKDKIKIETKEKTEEKPLIDYEDFAKLDLRVAKIIDAEKVPKSKKLIKLRISLGDEERTIVGGIALYYSPEDLVGKKIIIIKNLKPRKLMGITSQGMLLAASNEEEFSLLSLDRDVKEGSKIS